MFETEHTPRVFSLPPGCGFAGEFTRGFLERFGGGAAQTMAQAEIYLNTGRLRRGVTAAFAERGAFLLPQFRLVTELARDTRFYHIPPPIPALRRRLELFQAVSRLLENDERFAPGLSAFDLADGLAVLMDEMHAEGVSPDVIGGLDVSQHSEHWAQSLKFLDIITQFWGRTDAPDIQARQRMVVEFLVDSWRRSPPSHPVLVAGSTGSRGATRLLMQAAARLPQGAVILPCFDECLPETVWDGMKDSETGEDHPQFRFKTLLDALEMGPSDVRPWQHDAETLPQRNRLISLALRPAPVTGQWLAEGPRLEGLESATGNLTLLEAPHPRAEAVAVALRLRQAAETGETAALVTADRRLARQVKAALSRWGIQPEDSFEEPLADTAPGQLLQLVAGNIGRRPDPVSLITLLRHPLTHAGGRRSSHVRRIDRIEHKLRRRGMSADLHSWLSGMFPASDGSRAQDKWRDWLMDVLAQLESVCEAGLADIAAAHLRIAETLAAGPEADGHAEDIWNASAGKTALELMRELCFEGSSGGRMDPDTYRHLFASLAHRRTVPRRAADDFPGISIWNTLDARMQSPDLVIAGGLNEGAWPAAPPVDPWLNRDLRRQAGLLMPERMTGLLAHDFQQAASARSVVLSRSERRADEPAVPARWLIRLTTLLAGIGGEGAAALDAMRRRGRALLALAREMERPKDPVPRAERPNPKPPLAARPGSLSVTAIKTLISNPYEIYARHVLKLRELDPLQPDTFAAARGTALHEVLHRFVEGVRDGGMTCAPDSLLGIADEILEPMPAPEHIKRLWHSQLEGIAQEFIEQELRRAESGTPAGFEVTGECQLDGMDFRLTARADRVDAVNGGGLALFDYKTGTIPGDAEIRRRDKQLALTAKMLESGSFPDIPADRIRAAAYIGVGKSASERPVKAGEFDAVWHGFRGLIMRYGEPETGYISRRNMNQMRYGQGFDHLARYGEWDETTGWRDDRSDA